MKNYYIQFLIVIIFCSFKTHYYGDDKHLELAASYKGVCKVGKRGGDGTLVDPQWVLTAGHVAEGMYQRFGTSLYVYLGNDSMKVRNVFLHPDYKAMGDADMALLELEEKTIKIPHYQLYEQSDELNQKIVVVGHGDKRKPDGTWLVDGKKRAFSNIVDEVNEHYIIFNYSAPGENPTELEWTCGPGDSGGPAFIKSGGNFYLAGVSSKGEPGKEGKATYGSIEYFVRVSSYTQWLKETIKNPAAEKALRNIKQETSIDNSHHAAIDIITKAFEDFSEERMKIAIKQIYATEILKSRDPAQIMSNMPVMMRELSGARFQGIVSASSEKIILKMQKGANSFHLELFTSPAEPNKIEQMAFGKL